ncbi:MAG: helix-turn-helix domain-containing protein [Gemmatimonadaceae bacterium]
MISGRQSAGRPATTRDRLLEAALECAVRDGSGALSLQTIASAAAVSKALLLYHFRDKDDVLATLVAWLTSRCVSREGVAMLKGTPAGVLDTLWNWLDSELQSGELRVLIELGAERGIRSREALSASGSRRQQAAEATSARVFQLLGLTPRVPLSMLASAELAMREGLVVGAARAPERAVRAAFDVFWLAALGLAQ